VRLLIVEDEPTLGNQLKSTLEGVGYAVDLATDGEDGHYLGSTENYDAVILDLGLPEIDGLTVLDRWRKEGKVTPVLVLTARDSWSDKSCQAVSDAGTDRQTPCAHSPRFGQCLLGIDRRRRSARHPIRARHFGGRASQDDCAGI
jgi:CheY-like chemotaxis protein